MQLLVSLALVLGCGILNPASSADDFDFLGPDIEFPLVKWTAEETADIFEFNHTIWRACVNNNLEENVLEEKGNEMTQCGIQLSRKTTRAHSRVKNLRDMCSRTETYFYCMDQGAEDYKTMCNLKDDVENFLMDTLANNKAMINAICEDDEAVLLEYLEKEGDSCVKNVSEELNECVEKHARDEMMYDEEGCMHARNFMRCVDYKIATCDTDKARIIKHIIDQGLMATHCKDFDPRMGAASVFSSLLVLTTGTIAGLLAWRF